MAAESRTSPATADASPTEGVVCPFCAYVRSKDASGACPKCTMEDTPGTRRSTGERIGPWFVLQRKNPTAPGLRFSVLLTLARRGHVTAHSIVRGPTTGQLWKYAVQVKGLSRIFGICWHCHGSVSPDATTCPHCRSAQEIPDDPDQFLESHAALPVMREIPASALPEPEPTQTRSLARSPARESVFGSDQVVGTDDEHRELRSLAPPGARRRNASEPRAIQPGREAGQTIMSASELAAVFQLDAPAPPQSLVRRTRRRAWRLTKAVVVLVVVVGAAGAATAYLKPEWAAEAQQWAQPHVAKAQTMWADVRERLDSKGASATDGSTASSTAVAANTPLPPVTPIKLESEPASPKADEQPSRPAPMVMKPATQPSASVVVVDIAQDIKAEIDGLAAQASRFLPTTRPGTAPQQRANTPIERPREDAPLPPNVARPAPRETSPPPPQMIVNAPAPEQTIDEAIAQATELRNSALDAEARRDWKAAVIIYEQISKLPEAARPSDLKVRLKNAREQLAP